jgi:hypothetical protein
LHDLEGIAVAGSGGITLIASMGSRHQKADRYGRD